MSTVELNYNIVFEDAADVAPICSSYLVMNALIALRTRSKVQKSFQFGYSGGASETPLRYRSLLHGVHNDISMRLIGAYSAFEHTKAWISDLDFDEDVSARVEKLCSDYIAWVSGFRSDTTIYTDRAEIEIKSYLIDRQDGSKGSVENDGEDLGLFPYFEFDSKSVPLISASVPTELVDAYAKSGMKSVELAGYSSAVRKVLPQIIEMLV